MTGKSSGTKDTGNRRIAAVDRQVQALQLRRGGATLQAIADHLGYAGPQGAAYAIDAALKGMIREPAEALRELELQRIDRIWMDVWKIALNDELETMVRLKAMDRCLRLSEARCKLLGLDKLLPLWGGVEEELDVQALAAELAGEYDLESSSVLAEVEQIIRESQRGR